MMRRAEEQLGRAWAAGALPAVVNLFKGVNDVCLEKFGGEWGLVWRVDSSRISLSNFTINSIRKFRTNQALKLSMVTDSEEVKRFSFPGTAAHLEFLR
jgi:hypothetical protein